MATNSKSTTTKLPSEMGTLADAMASSTLTLLASMIVLGSSLSKAEVITKLRTYIALWTAVAQAKAAYVAALAARKSAEAAARAFYQAVIAYVKQAIGPNNPNLLSTFGVPPPKARKAMSVETKTIAVAKRAATRKARGTMGKTQRAAITAGAEPSVQVVGLGESSSSTPVGTTAPVSNASAAVTPPAPAAPAPAASPAVPNPS